MVSPFLRGALSHPRFGEFSAITEQAELAGLFQDLQRIGQKRFWEAWLARAGWRQTATGIEPVPREGGVQTWETGRAGIFRHKTALNRNQLSLPIQKLQQFGLLTQETTLFDFGASWLHSALGKEKMTATGGPVLFIRGRNLQSSTFPASPSWFRDRPPRSAGPLSLQFHHSMIKIQ